MVPTLLCTGLFPFFHAPHHVMVKSSSSDTVVSVLLFFILTKLFISRKREKKSEQVTKQWARYKYRNTPKASSYVRSNGHVFRQYTTNLISHSSLLTLIETVSYNGKDQYNNGYGNEKCDERDTTTTIG